MAIAADSRPDVVPTRLPGDFARHPNTGAPYVASLTKTRKRQGNKAELLATAERLGVAVPEKITVPQLHDLLGPEPAMVPYGRPSGFGKQIENTTNLQKWSERAVALGVVEAMACGETIDQVAELLALGQEALDLEHPDARPLLDAIAVQAKRLAQTGLAADRGTHTHALTEDADTERDWIERARAGEDLGIDRDVQAALVAAWEQFLANHGIEIMATEATVIDDVWHLAGTLDRIARLTRPLTFETAQGPVVLPAGWVGVLDVKTGRLRTGRDRHPEYWQGYAVQIASYAQSVPYDTETDARGEWPYEIDQRWGIIAHLDVRSAIEGAAVCRPVLVDLELGRAAGELCAAARAWEGCREVFSLIDAEESAQDYTSVTRVDPAPAPAGDAKAEGAPVAPSAEEVLPAPSSANTAAGAEEHPAAAPAAPSDDEQRAALRERLAGMRQSATDTGWRAEFEATLATHKLTKASTVAEIKAALDAIEPPFDGPSPELQPYTGMHTTAAASVREPVELVGPDVVAAVVEEVRGSWAHAIVNDWLAEANAVGRSWSPRVSSTTANVARTRAALALAEAASGDDDCTRLLLAQVLPIAEQPAFAIGACIAELDVAEARRVTNLAAHFGGPDLTLIFEQDGTPALLGDVAAVLAAA